MTPKEKKLAYMKHYRRKHRMEIRERDRIRWHGQDKRWWKLAAFKAGVPLRELDL